MKGWFDAFREDGGPTLYSYTNRTPANEDISSIFVYLIFATLFIAFLIIFPGIRKERFTTFLSVTLSLFVGLVILLTICGSDWHIARSRIVAPYKAFSREKIEANIGVNIGLNSVNVTLRAPLQSNQSTSHIQYNERFYWKEAMEIKEGYREALAKGLPFPILTVVEYFSLQGEGFSWGGRYRIAGYFSCLLLWASFAIWLLMNILFCVVPRYGAYAMILTGLLLLLTNVVYYANLPATPMIIPFEDSVLRFSFGWCYWLILATGFICICVGSVIAVVDVIFPHKFSTILEVDYDTPYDRHIILQDKCKERCGNGNCQSYGSRKVTTPASALAKNQIMSSSSSILPPANEPAPLSMSEEDKLRTGLGVILHHHGHQQQHQQQLQYGRHMVTGARDNVAFEGDVNSPSKLVSWKRQVIGSGSGIAGGGGGGLQVISSGSGASPASAATAIVGDTSHASLHRTQSVRYRTTPEFDTFIIHDNEPRNVAAAANKKGPAQENIV